MIDRVYIYQLKRKYGRPATVRHLGPVMVDPISGTESATVSETRIDRIIPPPPNYRQFTDKAMQMESLKFGGEVTVSQQVFLVDKNDLSETIKTGDELLYEDQIYQVVKGTDFSKGNLLEVTVERLKS